MARSDGSFAVLHLGGGVFPSLPFVENLRDELQGWLLKVLWLPLVVHMEVGAGVCSVV